MASAAFVLLVCGVTAKPTQEWKPAGDKMKTRWAEQVDPACPLPEYPRPQMVRPDWINLNGLWDYAVTPVTDESSDFADGRILVPFGIESSLSGVQRTFLPDEKLWYRRTFDVPGKWKNKRVLLHFGAVDYIAVVKVNGREAGRHQGGNTAFSIDITDFLIPGKKQELVVEVTDPTDTQKQPRGKQVLKPQGIWYTAVSGIWKTVWLEAVDNHYLVGFKGVPDVDNGNYLVTPTVNDAGPQTRVRYTVLDNGTVVTRVEGGAGEQTVIPVPNAKLWSPDSPNLYDLKIEVLRDGRVTDAVDSYFGMRKSSVGKDSDGYNRILLNDEFIFQYGFLDQGWWPDGLLTAPTEEALLYDIEFTKNAGYNTIRKHIKVESDRFYYHCDRLGLFVWQDAVSGNDFNLKDFPGGIVDKDPESARQFEYELKETMDQLMNYPSIVNWIVFNEGWGQYGERRVIDWAKRYDPSRLVEVSGWVDFGTGDIVDRHAYPGPGRVENVGPGRAFVVGEFGGLGLPLDGHLWNPQMRNWGYATYYDKDEFEEAYKAMIVQLEVLIGEGLSGAIYTQTTDVEGEVNGMLTYDREVEKIPAGELQAIHAPLYAGNRLVAMPVLPDAQVDRQPWFYTVNEPAPGWYSATTVPQGFEPGMAPFGYNYPLGQLSYSFYERTDPTNVVATEWIGGEIWLWKEFEVTALPSNPYLRVRYDAQIEVYINGVQVVSVDNRQPHYYHADMFGLPAGVLKSGTNTIAVVAKRNTKLPWSRTQMLDAGIVDLVKSRQ